MSYDVLTFVELICNLHCHQHGRKGVVYLSCRAKYSCKERMSMI